MHLGINEPDLEALIVTLRAISITPAVFSLSAISIAATMAADVLDKKSNTGALSPICEGQISIDDYLDSI